MVILTKEPYYGWILIIYKTYKFNLGILKKKKKKPTYRKLSFFNLKKGKFFDTSKKKKKKIILRDVRFIYFLVRNI